MSASAEVSDWFRTPAITLGESTAWGGGGPDLPMSWGGPNPHTPGWGERVGSGRRGKAAHPTPKWEGLRPTPTQWGSPRVWYGVVWAPQWAGVYNACPRVSRVRLAGGPAGPARVLVQCVAPPPNLGSGSTANPKTQVTACTAPYIPPPPLAISAQHLKNVKRRPSWLPDTVWAAFCCRNCDNFPNRYPGPDRAALCISQRQVVFAFLFF